MPSKGVAFKRVVGIPFLSSHYSIFAGIIAALPLLSLGQVTQSGKTVLNFAAPSLVLGDPSTTAGSAPLLQNLIFRTDGGERARIDKSGNLGIGTPTPASLNARGKVLEISSALLAANSTPGIVLRSGTGFTSVQAWELLLSGYTPDPKYCDFQIVSGTAGRLYLSGKTGFMGVNNTDPDRTLTVGGQIGVTGASAALVFKNPKVWDISSQGNDLFINENGIGTRMAFKQGGRIGIDTVDPGSTLFVKGDIGLTDGTGGILSLYGNSDGAVLKLGKKQGGNRDFQFVGKDFYTNAETELARITAQGNLGIGTNNPVSLNNRERVLQLDARNVSATANPGIVLRSGTTYSSVPAWEMLLSANSDVASKATDFQLLSGTSGRLYVSGVTGNVGVNSINPDRTLSVGGQIGITGSSAALVFKNPKAWDISSGGNDLQISETGVSNRMTFKAGGGLDIGTTTNAVAVHVLGSEVVDGELQVASVKTKVWSIAPDYVFENGYKLASLDHVEKYVSANKHLPDIPSAKEIKNKGMDLADMNLRLLKKVEELTLYAIEQEKRDRKRDEEVSELRNALAKMNSESKAVGAKK